MNQAPMSPTPDGATSATRGLVRGLSRLDAFSIVVGTVIGTGIFLKTAVMAQELGSAGWVLAAWAAAGVLSLAGALTYAELGAMFPEAGGEYVYLREAWGRVPAYLYGWARFWIGTPASIAAYAVGAATFLATVVQQINNNTGRVATAIVFIAVFTALNCTRVQVSGRTQSLLTIVKIVLVLGLIGGVFLLGKPAPGGLRDTGLFGTPSTMPAADGALAAGSGAPALSDQEPAQPSRGADSSERPFVPITATAFAAAMIAALWAFDGWNNLPMVAGEVKEPQRNVPFALGVGTLVILAIYAMANLAYFWALPFEEIVTSSSTAYPDAPPVATKAVGTFLGERAAMLFPLAFVFCALGAMNGSILTGARVPFALAADGLFPRSLAHLGQRSSSPIVAVIVTGAWSVILALWGTFDRLTDMVVFSSWIFYGMNSLAVLKLRKTRPDVARPYKTPLMPLLPLVFFAMTLWLLGLTLYKTPKDSGLGLLIILLALPLIPLFWQKPRQTGASEVINSR